MPMFDELPILLPLYNRIHNLFNLRMMNFFLPVSLCFSNPKTKIGYFCNLQSRLLDNKANIIHLYNLSNQYTPRQFQNYKFQKSDTNTIFREDTGYGDLELKRQ